MIKYPKKFKEKIIIEYQKGYSNKELKQKYDVLKTYLYDWLKLYKVIVHKDEKQFTYKQYKDLQRQFERASRKLEIIKTTNCLPSSPRKQKQ